MIDSLRLMENVLGSLQKEKSMRNVIIGEDLIVLMFIKEYTG